MAPFLAQARRWIKTVIEATGETCLRYKPSLASIKALVDSGHPSFCMKCVNWCRVSVPLILDAQTL